ncbi:GCN5-related N-acetyltransferase [Trametes coccinea BRFM310]|uniref:GCN5-related N-acetyltransferase n=1 Tax=Trametes coccinea (strain BRFM310) TaxID=1353009 RepID=A0A1Y2IVY1_TRAC3|nr:GCN5-related N-acetyltransferase [Trametes coccinea BRFM310]
MALKIRNATLKIRDATADDLPAIQDIFNDQILHSTAIFRTHLQTLEERTRWLQDLHAECYPCVVAEITNAQSGAKQTIGWANLRHFISQPPFDGSAEVSLYVHEDFRGKGVGEKLYQGLLEETRKQGTRFHTIIAVVATENERAMKFWQKQEFKPCGTLREVGHKFGRWLDTTYLQTFV